ncbi:MAG: hypothetical protein ACK5JU_02485 [Bacteroidales bacterium]
MAINQLVQFCRDSYQKDGKCERCPNTCNNCNICLQEIHNDQRNLRIYDCKNMIFCYVCNYINKHASEIYYGFNTFVNHPSTKKEQYNILSVGCGDCADLFGIMRFVENNQLKVNVSYTGVDFNEKWRPIHEQIIKLYPEITLKYEYQDIFTYISSLEKVDYNIVILEYVLNEIRKYTPDIIDSFIDSFARVVVDRLPSGALILINDFNHKIVRDYFPKILASIKINNEVLPASLRFINPTTHTFGGIILSKDELIFNISVDDRFEQKSPCSSCIYIIYKQ